MAEVSPAPSQVGHNTCKNVGQSTESLIAKMFLYLQGSLLSQPSSQSRPVRSSKHSKNYHNFSEKPPSFNSSAAPLPPTNSYE